MNFPRVFEVLGRFSIFISAMLVVPLGWALWFGEFEVLLPLLYSLFIGVGPGLLLVRKFRDAPSRLARREGLVIVTGSWVIAAVLGGLPFLLSGMTPNPVDALFEAMSGFTTTGSTILADIEVCPKSLLFWRSLTHWLGGMGIIVLFVAVLPALGVGARLLYQFEVPGVESEDLKPRIRETAMVLWVIYLIMSGIETLLLYLLGLDLYDALIHTFGTVATGGFSTLNGSLGGFDIPAVEVVVTVFMFLAGGNFTLYFRSWRWKRIVHFKDPEFRLYAGLLLIPGFLFGIILYAQGAKDSLLESLRHTTFQIISVGTTTGYGTDDFDVWPHGMRLFLVLLMFVGGCAGSTGGGMKVLRFLLILRFLRYELRRFVNPRRVRTITLGGARIPDEVMRNTLAFFGFLIMIFVFASLGLASLGLELSTATTAVAATLGNIGPGLGAVGPTQNFSALPDLAKLILTFMMLLGRLEIFTALCLFTPALYRR